jgi:hypothetical protein
MIYPIWNSIASIESQDLLQKRKAITYWIVFSVPSFIIGSIEYIPFGSKILGSIPHSAGTLVILCPFLFLALVTLPPPFS